MHNEKSTNQDDFIYGAFNNWQDCSTAIQQIITMIPDLVVQVAYFETKYQLRIPKSNDIELDYWIIDTINSAMSPYLCFGNN